jgi:hypothetical protein
MHYFHLQGRTLRLFQSYFPIFYSEEGTSMLIGNVTTIYLPKKSVPGAKRVPGS